MAEQDTQISHFSPGAEQALKEAGYITNCRLSGRSLENLYSEHKYTDARYWAFDVLAIFDDCPLYNSSTTEPSSENQNSLFSVTSRTSQVAFHPDPETFFLRSDGKTIPEELHDGIRPLEYYSDLVSNFSSRLRQELGRDDVQAVMGNVSDWVELTFQNLTALRPLFGGHYPNLRTLVPHNVRPTVLLTRWGTNTYRLYVGKMRDKETGEITKTEQYFREDELREVQAGPLDIHTPTTTIAVPAKDALAFVPTNEPAMVCVGGYDLIPSDSYSDSTGFELHLRTINHSYIGKRTYRGIAVAPLIVPA